MKYGYEYVFEAPNKLIRTGEVEAKNEEEARIKIMKIAEKDNLFVQNIGKLVEVKNE
jgi:hypothetical protein